MFRAALPRRNPIPALFRYYSRSAKMSLKAISSKDAASLDKDLMEIGGWSLDQLMELAGLSVSQAVYRIHPPSSGKDVLVICGPGNNGGDGLVAARHLAHYGYKPSVYYPKQGKNELYQRLKTQLENLSVPFISDLPVAIKSADFLVDAIFGFSFGGPLREPFPTIISQIETASIPVLSVDAPSSWDIESGPPKEGPGSKFMPEALISLTAPKPCVKYYKGRHFLGGRFLTKSIADKYKLDLPEYPGIEQIVEVGVDAEGKL
ncbi:YjeF N-terminal domain-like protein [Aspergillus piperis CBS 112811]|uniref:NAD(P)H-hydrate epimerase n=4 Tax=Aspergillus subgen. Circumdati TaxID=2720871 RepID=A0A8G1R9E6_9EURO|nr:YjeF N-terminal domain-like protein [Aspergillus eucalypticola CBS 122712]XP_025519484.1 YjeF N-terminal domain-like protein [Aspergillus piperis CBS 112811]PWY69276.1 YjeF N-terminal domain-like protein [Aspergillus eucalypticola CBS 122712]RAH61562.1 YjeF N-terminal domain-like protein [Aspergillus piperis CBS 112811]